MRYVRRLCLPLLAGLAWPAAAQVTVNQILFPANVGRTLEVPVTIDYTRTSGAPAVIRTVIPSQLQVDPPAPPAGCVVVLAGPDTAVQCDVPAGRAGDSGTLTFAVRGANVGAFSLNAVGSGGSVATNSGNVRSSGDISVTKTRAPLGNLLVGQVTTFTLLPRLAAGADDLPPGAVVTVTDQLPGTAANFSVTAIAAAGASCNSAAAANASRTLTCTYTGPLTAAALNALQIVVTGTPGSSGNFVNTASVAADQFRYFDRDPANNTVNVDYVVDPASDLRAQGSFVATPVLVDSVQNLTLVYRNAGPTNVPAGGTVSTTIPAGFRVNALPPGCSGPATGVTLLAPEVVVCTAAAVANGAAQNFVLPLTMPAAAAAGNFTVVVAPPPGIGDAVPANNTVTLPYQVAGPYADLRIGKSKAPAGGAIAPGSTVTTTLTVINDAGSPSAATFTGAGGANPLVVVDYLRPAEIDGDTISAVSPGWTCSVQLAADPTNAERSRRVTCTRSAAGTLARGATLAVSFSTRVAAVAGQVALSNRACAGETALAELGLTDAQGPQPPGGGRTGNDCATAGNNLIATDVASGQAVVSLRKESSADNITFVDDPATPPTIGAGNDFQFWRITITTPATAPQLTIPTLNLADPLPGILNLVSPGAPAPNHRTPQIVVGSAVTSGSAGGGCPAVAAGASNLSCSFSDVAPGTTIVVTYAVQRPFAAGLLTNTATLSSPNALISGTTSDSAAVNAEGRVDVAATTKTITPLVPRIGQQVQFTITAQNLGPEAVSTAGGFSIVDDLNTDVGAAQVAYGDISASGANMNCEVSLTALAGEPPLAAGFARVRCLNATPVARYSTRTVTILARLLKPAVLPAAGNVFPAQQSNSARADVPDSLCEYKTETTTNASVSGGCNDPASTSNNVRSVGFGVQVPQIDLQQIKERVLPVGQTSFGIGQPLRYRFRLQNNGPSRAEAVQMTDRLTVPAGFTLASPQVFNVNDVAPNAGYTLDTTKNGSVSCTQAAPNADIVCVLSNNPAQNFLDAGREVNFEVVLAQTGSAAGPVSFRNEALVCGAESAGYESSGGCDRALPSNNNLAAVNETIFPRTDLAIAKSIATPLPLSINQPAQFDLVVRNLGPNATPRLRVQDVLPANFELITAGPDAPTLLLGGFVTQAPSSATGATLACSAVPAVLAVAGQSQSVECVLDATPGPLGAGAFPGSGDAANTLTVRLFARAKEGLFTGPYGASIANNASVLPGLDGGGNPLSIDNVPGNNAASAVLQVVRASLAGRVFLDRNQNGAQDGTLAVQDEGLGGVTLQLSGTDAFGNPIARTLTSLDPAGATRGDFLFDHLPPGSYTITETQPAGLVNSLGTPAVPGAGGAYAAAATPATSAWSGIALAAGQAATGYLFPESAPPADISGVVFVDRNANGAMDGGEAGVPGVRLGLYPAGTVCPANGALPDGALQTVTTNAGGVYTFNAGSIGSSYVICQQQPPEYADLQPLPGTNGSTPRANQIDIANLPAGGAANQNFPERLGRIAGIVFADFNAAAPGGINNGVQDAGEPGLGSASAGAGVPVTLTGIASAGPRAGLPIAPVTVFTAADGSWQFEDLFPGDYTVTEGAVPAALGSYGDGINTAGPVAGAGRAGVAGAPGNNVIANILLQGGGAASTGNRFAELPRAAIAGFVYLDTDRNGQVGADEAIRLSGVVIELRQGGTSCADAALIGSTTTGAGGAWSFPGGSVGAAQVLAGQTYRVCEIQPPEWGAGAANPGVGANAPAANEIVVANLPASGSAGNLFGEHPASIAGSVYVDFGSGVAVNDNDGQRHSSEPGIAGVPVTLISGTGALLSTVTDLDGRYRFDNLPAGVYRVSEGAIPPGAGVFLDGRTTAGTIAGVTTGLAGANTIGGVTLVAGGVGIDYNFGELRPRTTISGTVYIDRDRDGRLTAADTGRLAGVVIRLLEGVGCGGVEIGTTTTQGDGSWFFPGGTVGVDQVQAGRVYTVCEVQPAGWADGATNPGNGGVTATLSDRIVFSSLPSDGSANNQFGEFGGSVSGRVFFDAANDGVFDAADSGIGGVTVTLEGADRSRRTAVTAADGSYRFDDLPAGSYRVVEQLAQPPVRIGAVRSTTNGITTAGTIDGTASGTATAVTVLPSAIDGIALPAGAQSINNDFGETAGASIAGRVWLDADANRVMDGPETGIAGVTLELSGTDDLGRPVFRTTTTGPDGQWIFDGLRPGVYRVTEPAQPPGTTDGVVIAGSAGGRVVNQAPLASAIADITLAAGAASIGNLFGEVPAAGSSISGRVWRDADDDGVVDPGETGIAGVTIELSGTDAAGNPVTRSVVTDADGRYRFDVPPGSYTLVEPAQPAGTVDGRTVPGSAGGSATAPGTQPSRIAAIALGTGQQSVDNNFGELPGASLAGRVWSDLDDDGVIDADEAGIGGVTVVLTGTDNLGRPVERTTTTGADGRYRFDDLRPGTYTVTEPVQPAGTGDGRTVPGSTGGSATPVGTLPSAIGGIVLAAGVQSAENNFGERTALPDLLVGKSALEARFTVGRAGHYTIQVRNVGGGASAGSYTVSDRLPAGVTLAATPTGSGWACNGAAGAGSFSCTSSTVLAAAAAHPGPINVSVNVAAAAGTASPVSNAVLVDGGGEPESRRPTPAERAAFDGDVTALPLCTTPASHNACRTATAVDLPAAISGSVWYDIGTRPDLRDGGDRPLPGWTVEIVDPASGTVIATGTTGPDGRYRIDNLPPGIPLQVRFREPGSGVVYGMPVNGETAPGSSGANCTNASVPSSCVEARGAPQLTVVLAPGQELPQQSLPVDPSGVVYDAVSREPVPGAQVTLAPSGSCPGWDPATQVAGAGFGGYTVQGGAIAMTTGANGFYQFVLLPGAPASCRFAISVLPPPSHEFVSRVIPPTAGPLAPTGAPGTAVAVQPQATAPSAPAGPGTTYYLDLQVGSATPDIVHNHIPVDPAVAATLALRKTGDRALAEVGDSVRYSIGVQLTAGSAPRQVTVLDRLPPGFGYIAGSAVVDGRRIADPVVGQDGRLAFELGAMPASHQMTLQYRVRIGVGAAQGDGINRAIGYGCAQASGCVSPGTLQPLPAASATNEGQYRVRVGGGVFGTDACVLGKVFVDCNGNQVQDAEELGIPGVRLVLQDGTTIVTDSEGKYNACGLPPRSHVLRIDPLTLPRGARLVTSSSRNLGDAGSLWLDLKFGELHRADFVEGSCSNPVLDQVKARRAQGEVRAPETEGAAQPALRFDSKSHGLTPLTTPRQGTDSAHQQVPKPRPAGPPDQPAKQEGGRP